MNTVVLRQSINRLTDSYGKKVTEIAAMALTARAAMRRMAGQHGVSAEGLLNVLDQCVESHLIEHDLHPVNLARCIAELEQDLATHADSPSIAPDA